jgi:hypothetical protein
MFLFVVHFDILSEQNEKQKNTTLSEQNEKQKNYYAVGTK